MKKETDSISTLFDDYFDDGFSFQKIMKSQTTQAVTLAKKIVQIINLSSDKYIDLSTISRRMHDYKKDNKHHDKLNILKEAIKEQCPGALKWKDGLYGASYKKILAAYWTELKIDFRLKSPMNKTDARQVSINPPMQNVEHHASAVMGTTFFTNDPAKLARNNQKDDFVTSHIMDACYCAYDKHGDEVDTLFIAVTDGLGGHCGDSAEDRRISRASRFAAKHAVRLLSSCGNADEVVKSIPKIIAEIAREIKCKVDDFSDSTTLTCAVAYKQEDKMRVVGFSIGDSMLISWQQSSGEIKTLLPGKQIVQKMGQGPAYLPANFDIDFDVEVIDIVLPADTMLIPFTDGISDVFKTQKVIKKAENGSSYELCRIDPDDLVLVLNKLKPSCTPTQCLEQIMSAVFERSEKMRCEFELKSGQAQVALEKIQKDKSVVSKFVSEKQTLNVAYDEIHQQHEEKQLTDDEYKEKRNELDGKKQALKAREMEYSNKIMELDSKKIVIYGDDIGIMAAKF